MFSEPFLVRPGTHQLIYVVVGEGRIIGPFCRNDEIEKYMDAISEKFGFKKEGSGRWSRKGASYEIQSLTDPMTFVK